MINLNKLPDAEKTTKSANVKVKKALLRPDVIKTQHYGSNKPMIQFLGKYEKATKFKNALSNKKLFKQKGYKMTLITSYDPNSDY